MAEPLAATSSGMASLERDVLLATKLHMPASRPGLMPRKRLAEQLDEGLARGLVLVCAPAGYGKTVLLADWVLPGAVVVSPPRWAFVERSPSTAIAAEGLTP